MEHCVGVDGFAYERAHSVSSLRRPATKITGTIYVFHDLCVAVEEKRLFYGCLHFP